MSDEPVRRAGIHPDSTEFELLHDPALSAVCSRHVPSSVDGVDAPNVRLTCQMQRDGRDFLAHACACVS